MSRPRVYTIASGSPFLPTLADALVKGVLVDGTGHHSLSDATLYVPTRRAAQGLAEALSLKAESDGLFLPRIVPLGGLDDVEDRLILEHGLEALLSDETLLPEIDPVHRRLVLTRLVLAWSKNVTATLSEHRHSGIAPALHQGWRDDPQGFVVAATPQDAIDLADALGTLIDTLAIHNKGWADLHALIPVENDEYWRISRNFLEIAAATWPQLKSEHGVMDLAERRHRLLLREAERLKMERPDAPVIAAGSTGSMPATAALLAAIAHLPRGAVILPALDLHLDKPSFSSLLHPDGRIAEASHPQAQLAHLLRVIGIERDDVLCLGEEDSALHARSRLLSEAMRPADTTDLWKDTHQGANPAAISEALSGLALIEADHEREEALAIAIALREVLETPDMTAALVTPDRGLAQRVMAELTRWNVVSHDSAGLPLKQSEAGRLATLLIDVIAQHFHPVAVMALLDHPAFRMGVPDDVMIRAHRVFDVALARNPFLKSGVSGLSDILIFASENQSRHRPFPERRLVQADFDAARILIEALSSLEEMFGQTGNDLTQKLLILKDALYLASARPSSARYFETLEGADELLEILNSLSSLSADLIDARTHDLPPFLDRLMRGVTLDPPALATSRIGIYGLLEARLLRADRVIVAGLDETIWPPQTRADPFLTRPAREALGLPSPERRIGQTAHDFVSALGTKNVMMTHAAKRGGDPMVPSRFLQRLHALIGDIHYESLKAKGAAYLSLARQLDESPAEPSLPQPKPVPARALLPSRLSVTEIETMRRDPYSIYAKHILKLDALSPIGRPISAGDLGSLIHDALGSFTQDHSTRHPDNAFDELCRYGTRAFTPLAGRANFSAFWWPRFLTIAQWFIPWDAARRDKSGFPIIAEESGQWTFALSPEETFTLSARADRIEKMKDGSLIFIDFKTGTVPSNKQVQIGLSPQLTLEAAIALHGGFKALTSSAIEDLFYVKLGSKENGKETHISAEEGPLHTLIEDHVTLFKDMITAHWLEGHPFLSRPIAEYARRFGDYDHLARVKEWSSGQDSDEDTGDAS